MKTNQKRLRFVSLLICILCGCVAYAQTGNMIVTGTVVDDTGEPLPGAAVAINNKQGIAKGTTTNIEGEFMLTINLEQGDKELLISFMGMKTKKVKLNVNTHKETLNIQLFPDDAILEEVTIVEDGYNRLPRKDMVGAFTTVKAEDIMMPAFQSIDQMLQGKIAGMTVVNSSARVGATPKITIRGTSTILGNTSPLWVVDGVIQEDEWSIDMSSSITSGLKELIGNQISWLNPQDIDNITVLKDASATAIYGSKASNGVIVITTKKGAPGRISVNYNANVSVRERPRYDMYDYMNSKERITFSKEAYEAGVRYQNEPLPQIYTYEGLMAMFNKRMINEQQFSKYLQRLETVNTDWFDLLTRNSISQNHNLSVSGGTQKYTYNASVGYSDNKGYELGNENDQITSRLSINSNVNEKLSINVQLNGSVRDSRGYGAGVNPYSYAMNTSRAIPAFEENGDRVFYSKYYNYQYNRDLAEHNQYSQNIFNEMENSYSKNRGTTFNASANITYKILDWLTYQGTASMSSSINKGESYAGERTSTVEQLYRGYPYGSEKAGSEKYNAALMPHGGVLNQSNTQSTTFSTSQRLQFSKEFNQNHRLNAMLGLEIRTTESESESNTAYGFVPERGEIIVSPALPSEFKPIGFGNMTIGLGVLDALYNSGGWNKTSTEINFVSFFSTLAYTFMNRYVVNVNVRSDASNRFGQDVNQQFDPAWSFGASWKIAQEPFVANKLSWLDQMNLRFSYGIQGNVVSSISPEMIVRYSGLLPSYKEYYLTISSLPNPQLDWERTRSWNLGLDLSLFGITMNVEYYGRRSNAIIRQDIAQEYGVKSMPLNGGIITNQGVEFTLNYTPVRTKDFIWTVGFNASKNWNKSEADDRTAKADELNHTDFLNGSSERPLKSGYPLSAFWSYKFTGLNPVNGYPTFANATYDDVDGDGTVDPTTFLVYSGQGEPYFTGGFNTRFRWKDFNFGADFALILGSKKRLPNPYDTFTYGKMPDIYGNLSKELNDRWKKPGDEAHTNIPALYTSVKDLYNLNLPNGLYDNIYSMWAQSDVRVADASFLRCTQISLSYSLPRKICSKIGLSRVQISANINNLFVIASDDWKGYDPELGYTIQPRVYSMGLSIGL
ncbi:MAG: SusC/RagA family TonB-linked outer membrane protein [Bacteroidaceae bacterium]|nr:SusC/RagA family TonB-linked outer membrane protein [Bacteroidaceae bacterium]